jgi:DNA invertase Pin-like site-specific DNA recombinase
LGRPLTASKKSSQIRELYHAGVSKAAIARKLNIGRTSVRRILAVRTK